MQCLGFRNRSPGLRIRIISGNWIRIRIRVKSWIRIGIKVKIRKLHRLKTEQRRTVYAHNEGLESENGALAGL
jgi:hypothetical protein